jgi:ubiquitin carboxyl-terminal hydrolase 8
MILNDNTSEQIEAPKLGVSKYKNIMGITCYMNSILHILQHVPVFVEYITQAKFREVLLAKMEFKLSKEPNLDKEEFIKNYVIFELFRLFKVSFENDDSSITPTSFKQLIGKKNEMWNEWNHQDSQEFFNFLVSQLEEEVGVKTTFLPGLNYKDTKKLTLEESIFNILATHSWSKYQGKEYSPLKNIFDGMIESNNKCMCCGSKTFRYEPIVTLSVSIPIKDKNDITKSFSIYDCLDFFTKEEQLDSNNKMNCEMCGLKNRAYSNYLLWKTPKLLVIHIKRFSVNSLGIPTHKINNEITYPIVDLDLSKYFNPASPYKSDCKYDLIGINIHQAFGFGNSINAGHYTSIVKNFMNHNWYLYNDSNPVQMAYSSESLQNKNACMLFYYRHN